MPAPPALGARRAHADLAVRATLGNGTFGFSSSGGAGRVAHQWAARRSDALWSRLAELAAHAGPARALSVNGYALTRRPPPVKARVVAPRPADRRLTELRDELRAAILGSAAETRAYVDARLREEIAGLEGRLRGEMGELEGRLRGEIAGVRTEMRASAAETRRHFDVIAEQIVGQVRLVAEGATALTQRLDRFEQEVGLGFATVDHRLLRLEARVFPGGGDDGRVRARCFRIGWSR
jgi:hypothetical protein